VGLSASTCAQRWEAEGLVLGSLGEAEAERKASKAESAESINRSSKQRMLEKAPITMGKMALPWEEKFILLLHC